MASVRAASISRVSLDRLDWNVVVLARVVAVCHDSSRQLDRSFRFPEPARRHSPTRCHQQLAVQLLAVIVDDSDGIVHRLLQPRRTDVLKHGGIALVTSVGHQAISCVYCHQRAVRTTSSCFDYNISSAFPSLQSAFLLRIAVSPDATAFQSSVGVFVSVTP